jgi:hypothetical protein
MYLKKIEELELPEPKCDEKQYTYILRILLLGIAINTRICRYIGIGNLHSLVSELKKKRIPHTVEHRAVIDPATGKLNPYPVDVVWITAEQKQFHINKNT